jgi:hypothetical protein
MADGGEAPFPAGTGLWLLLPSIGAFVWFIKIHARLQVSTVRIAPSW